MTTRSAVRYVGLVACVVAWLLAGECVEAGIRGNAYRVTTSIFGGLPYENYYFSESGIGPLSQPYTELDYGLFSIWSSQARRTADPSDVEIDHVGISVLGLTISGTRAEYYNNFPFPTRLGLISGYLDPRCGPGFERERIRGFNTSNTAVYIIAEGEPLSAATRVPANSRSILDVQLPVGYPVVGEGTWRPDPFATTQILWDGSKLICNPEPPLP